MSIWKKKITAAGVTHFWKDGKAVKPEDFDTIPAIVVNMEPGTSIEIQETPPVPTTVPASAEKKNEKDNGPKPEERVSIISGEPATRRRFLNGQEYWLTQEEYTTYNLGKLAQAIRENRETVASTTK